MDYHLTFNSSYLYAFAMGLLSSLHCVGMCGSIIGTLTLSLRADIRQNKRTLLPYILNYNLGRIFSYMLAGLIAGALTYLLTLPFNEGHGHRFLQILSAVCMASAGLYIAGWYPRFAYIEKAGATLWKKIEPFGRRLIPVHSKLQAFLFGTIWGWLPCGLVYTALVLATSTGDVIRSGMTMLAFGLGTLPAALGIGIMTDHLNKLAQMKTFKWLVGVAFIAIAVIAVLPWLNPMRLQHV